MAVIEKRTNKKGTGYRVLVRLSGYPNQSATFKKLADAKLWATQTEMIIRDTRYAQMAKFRRKTLRDLITRYQAEILPYKSSSLLFIKGQHNQLEWWKQQLGEYYLSDVTASCIAETRNKLTTGPATANRYLAALSHVYSVAVKQWEWVHDSPVTRVIKLREPRGRVRYLSDAERRRLLSVAANSTNRMLHLIIVLALSTGARKGELLNLEWEDIDFARRRLIFQNTKNGEKRRAPLGKYALELLKLHHQNTDNKSSYVFLSKRGSPIRIDREFRVLIQKAGIENFRFHDLRHSAASYLAMSGATMTDIAEILGHKTLAMVKRYTHLSDSHTSLVIERMNESIF